MDNKAHLDKDTRIMFRVQQPAPHKRCKLDVPYHVARQLSREQQCNEYACALTDLNQLIQSKREVFEAGHNGLQAYRAQAIRSCLQMIVKNGCRLVDASHMAAESEGFAERWPGSPLVMGLGFTTRVAIIKDRAPYEDFFSAERPHYLCQTAVICSLEQMVHGS